MPIPNDALETMPPRPYEAVKGDIRTGDLILCSGDGAFSRAIRVATSSPWSHIAIAVRLDAIDKVIVMESVETIGVRAGAPNSVVSRDGDGREPCCGRACQLATPDATRPNGMTARIRALTPLRQQVVLIGRPNTG